MRVTSEARLNYLRLERKKIDAEITELEHSVNRKKKNFCECPRCQADWLRRYGIGELEKHPLHK